MKAILEFNLPEEKYEFDNAVSACNKEALISVIWNEVFKQYWKDGIPDEVDKESLLNHLVHKFNIITDREHLH